MEECCAIAPPKSLAETSVCPQCGRKGKAVKALTVRALVKEEHKSLVRDGASYRYCASPGCGVVYFGETGWTAPKEYLAVRVGSKETEDPIPVCYCYGYSREDIRRDVRETGAMMIPERIRAEVKAGRCQCEVKNPSGACCLGDIGRAVKEAQSEFGPKEPPMDDLEQVSPTKNISGMVLGGALTTGFLASACCLGPLVLAVLGLGGAGFLLKFEAYRPLFILVTLVLLGAGFYLAYRAPSIRLKTEAALVEDCACEYPRSKRAGKMMLWIVAPIVVLMLLFPQLVALLWG